MVRRQTRPTHFFNSNSAIIKTTIDSFIDSPHPTLTDTSHQLIAAIEQCLLRQRACDMLEWELQATILAKASRQYIYIPTVLTDLLLRCHKSYLPALLNIIRVTGAGDTTQHDPTPCSGRDDPRLV